MNAPLLQEVLAVVRSVQPRARDIGVEFVGVVGSVARGETGPQSDVDLVYDVHRDGHLWDLLGVAADIEDRLGRRVDLVDRAMVRPELWLAMARDLAPV